MITFLLIGIITSFLSTVIGNVYVADTFNYRIRKVTVSTGVISTIAGTGTASYSGDGGAATSAALYYPQAIGLDSTGTITTPTYVNRECLTTCYRQRVCRRY